jgi:hypothetical protein
VLCRLHISRSMSKCETQPTLRDVLVRCFFSWSHVHIDQDLMLAEWPRFPENLIVSLFQIISYFSFSRYIYFLPWDQPKTFLPFLFIGCTLLWFFGSIAALGWRQGIESLASYYDQEPYSSLHWMDGSSFTMLLVFSSRPIINLNFIHADIVSLEWCFFF